MNKHDKDNYQFLMSLTPDQFEDWVMSLSTDDVEYAIELIQIARSELAVHTAKILDDVKDVTEASNILKRFTLKGE
jgi:hypothetical protein